MGLARALGAPGGPGPAGVPGGGQGGGVCAEEVCVPRRRLGLRAGSPVPHFPVHGVSNHMVLIVFTVKLNNHFLKTRQTWLAWCASRDSVPFSSN